MKMMTAIGLCGAGLVLGACVPEYGAGPGGPPPPVQEVQPASLPSSFAPTRRNYIQVSGNPGSGSGSTQICVTNSVSFDKGFKVNGGSLVAVEKGQRKCRSANGNNANVTFFTRAAGLGGLKERTTHTLNLTGWGGGTIEMDWTGE